jgi:quinol monooxygenase YgiN
VSVNSNARKEGHVIFIVVKHPVRHEYADDWLDLVHDFTIATRAEPGNISFDWYRSADDPKLWLLVEAFRSAEAGQAHVESVHFQEAIANLPKWLTDVPEIVHVEIPGDDWARMSEVQIEP